MTTEECWEIDRKLVGCATRRAAIDLEEAKWLVVADRDRTYLQLGFATMLAYMEQRLGYSPKVAYERLRVAKALQDLPAVAARLDGKRLGYGAVRELTRVVTPSTEEAWASSCEGKTLREVERLVAGHEKGDLPTDPRKPDLRLRTLRFDVPPGTYALYREAQRAVEQDLGHRLSEEQLFAELCRSAIERASGRNNQENTRNDGGSDAAAGRASHQIALTLCEECERATQDGAGATVDVPPAAVAQALCDAQHLGRVDGRRPPRATQTIPPRIRRQVVRRDHGRCTVPGCRSSRFLQVHHLVPREEGGSHDPSNLTLICGAHHRLVHEGAITITGSAPAALKFDHASLRTVPPDDVQAPASIPIIGSVPKMAMPRLPRGKRRPLALTPAARAGRRRSARRAGGGRGRARWRRAGALR